MTQTPPLHRNSRLQTEYLDIQILKPMPGAPRRHPKSQIRALVKSLEAFGQVLPILIDAQNRIISGHAQLEAARKLGMHQVMVIRILGSAYFSAQYLQAPVPLEGNFVKRHWFRHYHALEVADPERIIQSWDTASKAGQLNDYSVGTTWALKGERIYLLDVVREKLEFPALKRRVTDEADRWKADLVLIEDKGSGMSLLQDLMASGFWTGRAVQPVADKATRFVGISAMIEAGRVYLPHGAVWLEDYLHELCGFPGLKHDDQVDSTSQVLEWLRQEGNPGGLWHYMRQEHEKLAAKREHRAVQLRAPRGVSHASMRDGRTIPVGSDGTIWVSEDDAGPLIGVGFVRLK